MAKFALCFLLSLLTLQASQGSNLHRENALEEVVAEFTKALKEIEQIIIAVDEHLTPIAREFEFKIEEIVMEHATYPTIQELRDTITSTEAEVSDESKSCIDTAWRSVMVITEETKRSVDNCISGASETEGQLRSIAETMEGKLTKVRSELTSGYHKCISQGSSVDDTVACLREVLDLAKDDQLLQSFVDAYEAARKVFDDGVRNLNICMQRTQSDLKLKSDFVIDALNRCVQSNGKFLPRASRGIFDFIRDLKEKIETIIHIASHLPTSIAEIPDKINEIISHINISNLIAQLKSEVEDIIDNGGRNAEKCRPDAEKTMDALATSAESTSRVCMDKTEVQVDEVEAEVKGLVKKGKQLLSEVNGQILTCITENILNPVGFTKCVERHVDEYKEKIDNLQQEVKDTFEQAKVKAADIIHDLAKCMNTIQLDTIKDGQVIIENVETCVRNSHNLF